MPSSFAKYCILSLVFIGSYLLVTGSIALARGRRVERQKLVASSPPPTSGPPTHQDSQIKQDPSEIDKQILNGYDWTTCKSLTSEVRAAIEEALLKRIILQQLPSLTLEETTTACFRLLQDKGAHGLLLSCWEEQSFEALRSHSTIIC
jgi:hypothetical protein